MKPIFILATRSFWLAVVSVALFLSQGPEAIDMVARALSVVIDRDPEPIAALLVKLSPIVTLVLAIHQRSGAARPYSLVPKWNS